MTSPADELRTAAKKIRSLATAATPGPWAQTGIGDYGWTVSFAHPDTGAETADSDQGRADADYIAAMGPTVGAALAQLLDDCAELHEANPPHRGQPRPGCQWCADEDFPCADMRNALAVARAINTGGQP